VLKEVRPGSIEAFCYASFVAIANVKRCTLSCSRFAPHYGRLFGPLSPIVISVTIIRRHDITLLSISATVFAALRPHELTLLSSVLSTPDTRIDKWPLQPRSGYKRKPFTQSCRCEKLHFHPSLALSLSLFLLQLALTTLALAISSIYSVPRRANCSSVFVPDVKEKLRVDREKNSSQDATHDSVLGRRRVVSLDIVRDVPLYRRRIMSAISCACAHSSFTSSWTTMR
jgi:hypothetical protein